MWQGVVGPGKYYYEATVTDEGLCRLGVSTTQASLGNRHSWSYCVSYCSCVDVIDSLASNV